MGDVCVCVNVWLTYMIVHLGSWHVSSDCIETLQFALTTKCLPSNLRSVGSQQEDKQRFHHHACFKYVFLDDDDDVWCGEKKKILWNGIFLLQRAWSTKNRIFERLGRSDTRLARFEHQC